MEITDPAVNQYMQHLLPVRDKVLAEMEALAEKDKIGRAHV